MSVSRLMKIESWRIARCDNNSDRVVYLEEKSNCKSPFFFFSFIFLRLKTNNAYFRRSNVWWNKREGWERERERIVGKCRECEKDKLYVVRFLEAISAIVNILLLKIRKQDPRRVNYALIITMKKLLYILIWSYLIYNFSTARYNNIA